GIASFLPGIPGLQNPRHLIEPRHFNRATGLQNDDGLWISRCNRTDQFILTSGQVDGRQIAALRIPFAVATYEDEGNIALACYSCSLSNGCIAQRQTDTHAERGYAENGKILRGELDDNFDRLAGFKRDFAHDFVAAFFKEG